MNNLRDKRCYLSGPIENDNTSVNWRVEPSKVLKEGFGIDLFDPFSDPKQQWVPALKQARESGDSQTMVKIAKLFVRKDLCMVDRADFTIAYLPYKVPTTGTTHEIINSNNAKKPTLLVTDSPNISYIPLWYFGFISTEFMFAGWNALYIYLEAVDRGKHKDNNRWSYIYGEI
jgi:nucleoside 2-deoxyribosyltransferase